jgi:hypothetical protein
MAAALAATAAAALLWIVFGTLQRSVGGVSLARHER